MPKEDVLATLCQIPVAQPRLKFTRWLKPYSTLRLAWIMYTLSQDGRAQAPEGH